MIILKDHGFGSYEKQVLDDVKNRLKMVGNELAIGYRTIVIAIDAVDEYLNTMGVKVDEITERNDVLKDEDKDFIGKIIPKRPDKLPKHIFNNDEV